MSSSIDLLDKSMANTGKEGIYLGLAFLFVIGLSFPFVAYSLISDQNVTITTTGLPEIELKTEAETTSSTDTTTVFSCVEPLWKNDGFCDDLTNVQDCDYDGGDCCLIPSLGHYCDNCTCHETQESHVTTTKEPPPISKYILSIAKSVKKKFGHFFRQMCRHQSHVSLCTRWILR